MELALSMSEIYTLFKVGIVPKTNNDIMKEMFTEVSQYCLTTHLINTEGYSKLVNEEPQ